MPPGVEKSVQQVSLLLDGMGVGVMSGGLLIIVLRAFTPVQG